MSPHAILFDLDGTLVDSLADISASMNIVLKEHGFTGHSLSDYRSFIGDGMASLVERSLPEGSRDGQSVRAGVDRLRKVYAARACLLTRPYEGISELLGELTQRRIARGVLSNKPHDLTVALVAELLGEWGMDPVLGERAEVPCKPDPTAAFEAAALLGVAPTEILFVGDTPTDMETAKRAGMRPIGVAWGFRPTSELVHAGAFAIVTHPQQILSYLD